MPVIFQSLRRRQQELSSYAKAAVNSDTSSRRVLIFAQGRTGTWLMTHFLNAHPAVRCEKEILMFPKYAPIHYLSARSQLSAKAVYGCHVQINQLLTAQNLDPKKFLARLSAKNWRILYLKRQDIIRQSISTILATQRQQWYTYNLKELDNRPLTIDPNDLHQWLKRRLNHAQLESEALRNVPHLTVTYESDLREATNHQPTMNRIFDYLELPKITVKAQTQRLSSDSFREAISNYDALINSIRNTPFAQYTDLC